MRLLRFSGFDTVKCIDTVTTANAVIVDCGGAIRIVDDCVVGQRAAVDGSVRTSTSMDAVIGLTTI